MKKTASIYAVLTYTISSEMQNEIQEKAQGKKFSSYKRKKSQTSNFTRWTITATISLGMSVRVRILINELSKVN